MLAGLRRDLAEFPGWACAVDLAVFVGLDYFVYLAGVAAGFDSC